MKNGGGFQGKNREIANVLKEKQPQAVTYVALRFSRVEPGKAEAVSRNAIDGSAGRKHFKPGVNTVAPSRIKAARIIAITADFLQIALFPLFAEGFVSVLDDALDVAVCVTLTWLVGWHFSFLPSFVVKVLPVADMVPTWTLSVLLATRQKQVPPQPASPVTEVYAEPVPQTPPQLKNSAR